MMLLLFTLVAWACARSMAENVMRGTYPSNVTHILITDSNTNMTTSHRPDNDEERVDLSPLLDSALGRWHASRFHLSPENLQNAVIDKLASRIEEIDRKFSGLILARGHDNVLGGQSFLDWVKLVREQYSDLPESAIEAMFVVLADHFRSDADLASALVSATEISATKKIATELLAFQVSAWKNDGKKMTDVFDCLNLKQTESRLFESPLFLQWVAFLERIYGIEPKKIEQVILAFLKRHYKDDADNLAKVIVAGTKIPNKKTKKIAKQLLDSQIKAWGSNISEKEFFERLELHHGNPLENPLLLKWVKFVKSRYKPYWDRANKMMLEVLKEHFESDPALVSALVVGTEIRGTKEIARELLTFQTKTWVQERKNELEVFDLLKLRQTSGNLFDSPAFSAWADFVRLKHWGFPKAANEAMISTLKYVYKGDLGGILAEGTQVEKMKSFAETLHNVLQAGLPKPAPLNFDLNN